MSGASERRESLFRLLEALYSRLDSRLAKGAAEGNPCGRCRECCTGQGLSHHNVTSLELEYIEERVGAEKLQRFKTFVAREGDVEICPYFDESLWGCGIYSVRPFSCRLFGHFRSRETALPEVCVFRGQEEIFETRHYMRKVPQAAQLRDLVRRFWPFQRALTSHPRAVGEEATSGRKADPLFDGDELDQALRLQSEGRLQEALQTLAQSDLEQTPYALYCASLILEGLGLHRDAAGALAEALIEAPDCVTLHFRLACNLLSCGEAEAAEASLLTTLSLQSDHAPSLALLGGQFLLRGQRDEACVYLEQAALCDPEDGSIQRMLETARGDLG